VQNKTPDAPKKNVIRGKMAIRVWLSPRDVCALMATQSAVRRIKAMLSQSMQVSLKSPELLFAMASFSKFYSQFYNSCVTTQNGEILDRHRLVKVPRMVYLILKSLGFCIFQTEEGDAPLRGPGGHPVCVFGSPASFFQSSSSLDAELEKLKTELAIDERRKEDSVNVRLGFQENLRRVEDEEKKRLKNEHDNASDKTKHPSPETSFGQVKLHQAVLDKAKDSYSKVVEYNNIIFKIDDRIKSLKERISTICHAGGLKNDAAAKKLNASFEAASARHKQILHDENERFEKIKKAHENAVSSSPKRPGCVGIDTEYRRPAKITDEMQTRASAISKTSEDRCKMILCPAGTECNEQVIRSSFRKRSLQMHPDKVSTHERVVLEGLLSNPTLNGRAGFVTDSTPTNGKVHVTLDDGKVINVALERLIPMTQSQAFRNLTDCKDLLLKKKG